jgi:hypothetical protein
MEQEIVTTYYDLHKVERAVYSADYRKKNRLLITEKRKKDRKEGLTNKFEKGYAPRRFAEYKHDAKKKNRTFEITFEQFMTFWQKPCIYGRCSIKTIGLDRIDSSVGYIISNIVPCCRTHNSMKSNLTHEEFVAMCKKVVDSALEKR